MNTFSVIKTTLKLETVPLQYNRATEGVFGRVSKAAQLRLQLKSKHIFWTGFSREAGHEAVFGFHCRGEVTKSWLSLAW